MIIIIDDILELYIGSYIISMQTLFICAYIRAFCKWPIRVTVAPCPFSRGGRQDSDRRFSNLASLGVHCF